MKKISFVLAIAALLTVGAGFAGARPAAKPTIVPVTVVMHDPGCHWFSVGGKLSTTLTVHGIAKLVNYDEAALKVVGPRATKIVPQAKPILLKQGIYKITMVGQAKDDNHLKLIVR
jgi:hypothetical protein